MASTALLVIDMQNFFAPMTTAALPRIRTLIDHFHAHKLPVIFTQHGHTEEELTGPPYSNQLVRKWGPDGSIRKGSHDWQLQPPIQKLIDDTLSGGGGGAAAAVPIVAKNTYDAFINTDLDARLRQLGVARVVVCGVMTDCCCDTTARAAFNRGWETWLVRDACGSATKTQHDAGLKGFGFAFGDIVTAADVVDSVRSVRSSSAEE